MEPKPFSDFLPAKSIDEVLERLDNIIDKTVDLNNFLCAFAFVYRRTTYEVKIAIEAGRFEDAKRMEKMDVVFANLYLKAFYHFQCSKSLSKSWKFAFQLKEDRITLVQHILLGMNAHINLDLSIAASEVSIGRNIMDLKKDFMVINDILAELTNSMQKNLSRVSFLMRLLDFFGFRTDEKIINFSIKKAREFAWLNAMELSLIEGSEQITRISEIDTDVLELSKKIKTPPGKFLNFVLRFISFFEVRNPKKIIDKMRKA